MRTWRRCEKSYRRILETDKLREQAIELGLLAGTRCTFEQVAMLANAGRVLAADATSVFSWPSNGTAPGIRLNSGDKLI